MPELPASSSSAGLAALASAAARALDRCEEHPDGAAVATEPVPGAVDVDVDLVATLAALHRSEQRLMCVGDGVAFVGIGVAAGADDNGSADNGTDNSADDDVVALQRLLRVPQRRVALTLPFVRHPLSADVGDTSWRRLRRRRLWAPRVWIHADRDGDARGGVDLGDDVAASARAAALVEARAIIGAWGRADAAPADTSWDVGGFVAQPDQHAHHAAVVRATDVMGGASSALSKVVLARRRRRRRWRRASSLASTLLRLSKFAISSATVTTSLSAAPPSAWSRGGARRCLLTCWRARPDWATTRSRPPTKSGVNTPRSRPLSSSGCGAWGPASSMRPNPNGVAWPWCSIYGRR